MCQDSVLPAGSPHGGGPRARGVTAIAAGVWDTHESEGACRRRWGRSIAGVVSDRARASVMRSPMDGAVGVPLGRPGACPSRIDDGLASWIARAGIWISTTPNGRSVFPRPLPRPAGGFSVRRDGPSMVKVWQRWRRRFEKPPRPSSVAQEFVPGIEGKLVVIRVVCWPRSALPSAEKGVGLLGGQIQIPHRRPAETSTRASV